MIAHVDFAIPFILAALPCGLWQAPLFAFAAWLVLRVRPQANASAAHPAPKPAAGGSEDAAIPSNIVPYVPRRTSAPQLALKATGTL